MTCQIKAYMQIEIKDKNGRVVKRTRKRLSKSFVLQFLQHIEMWTAHAYGGSSDNVTFKDTSGNSYSMNNGTTGAVNQGALEAPVGNTSYGILVGTGTTPPTNTDYTMQTLIANGIGDGQLQYQATSCAVVLVVGANVDYQITRSLMNNSGGTITIREVGLACETFTRYYLLIRDSANQAVANGQTATVTYTIRTTV